MNLLTKDDFAELKRKFTGIIKRFSVREDPEEENKKMCLNSMTPRLGKDVPFALKKMAIEELAALLKVGVKEAHCEGISRGYRLETEDISPDFPKIALWDAYDDFSTDIGGLLMVVSTAVERNRVCQDEEGKS